MHGETMKFVAELLLILKYYPVLWILAVLLVKFCR